MYRRKGIWLPIDNLFATMQQNDNPDSDIAASIVADALNLSVRRVTPLVDMGSVNLIFFVEASDSEVVLRLSKPEDDVIKMRGEYDKERWCIERVSQAGIPSPTVLAVGEHLGRAFMIQNRIHGVNGKQSGTSPTKLLRTLGNYAHLIHTLPTNGFGDRVETFEIGKAQEGWHQFLDRNVEALSADDSLISLGVYKVNQQQAIRESFIGLKRLPLQVGLNHGDLSRRNTIIDGSGSVYLLDWGCAELHIVPHYELNSLVQWYSLSDHELQAFLDGYGITDEQWKALVQELAIFGLLKAFDLTRWAIDRCPSRITEIAERANRCLSACQDYL